MQITTNQDNFLSEKDASKSGLWENTEWKKNAPDSQEQQAILTYDPLEGIASYEPASILGLPCSYAWFLLNLRNSLYNKFIVWLWVVVRRQAT